VCLHCTHIMPHPLHTYHAMPSAVHFHVDLPRSTSLSPSHIPTLFLPLSFPLSLCSLPLPSHPKDGLLPGDEVDHLHLEDVPGKAQRCFAAIDCGVKVLKQFINLVALTTCRLSHAPTLGPRRCSCCPPASSWWIFLLSTPTPSPLSCSSGLSGCSLLPLRMEQVRARHVDAIWGCNCFAHLE